MHIDRGINLCRGDLLPGPALKGYSDLMRQIGDLSQKMLT